MRSGLARFVAITVAAGPAGCGAAAPTIDRSGDWIENAPPKRSHRADTPRARRDGELFRNTYYDFPLDAGGSEAEVFDARCQPVARVSRAFHDQVCVQGSGRLATGETISFARRDCACAAECPRTGQKICFDKLDPGRFPTGRGARGTAITPLRTLAVDSSVIPLGTPVYIPEFVGLPMLDGAPHDGCFLAEDRGSKVVGKHVDVFTGDPSMTRAWNAQRPSNEGVHVELDAPRCDRLRPR
jgi:3D (Asp-Asp-Asp) domain-containing protein